MDLEMLRERARIFRRVRSFFDSKGYLELDTPLLSPDLIPESCLEVFETRRVLPSGEARPYWLVPSPEIWMKKTVARHKVDVYQICRCFRNGESSGFMHSPEFTMLEYYTMDADYMDSLALTEELFAFLSEGAAGEGAAQGIRPPFERLAVGEAFSRFAGFDLFEAAATEGALEREARRLGLNPAPGTETAVLFDLVFVHAVEPGLRRSRRPVALLDYPSFVPCLARRGADERKLERWELYFGGIELANCFSEETDAGRVRDFFEAEARAKEERALVRHGIDRDYWKLFGDGASFPRCSGVAMGLDRLVMAVCGRSSIDSVLPFPMDP